MNLNDFYFTGQVVSNPETKEFTSNSKTSFMVEQSSTYREKVKTTTLTFNGWHKGASHLQALKIGDFVLVKGKFSSAPYKERFITNHDVTNVVVLTAQEAAKPSPLDQDFPF